MNNQRILDNHGNITQNGDILNLKGANINQINITPKNKLFYILFSKIDKEMMRKLNKKEFLIVLYLRMILIATSLSLVFIAIFFENNKVSDIGFILGFAYLGAILSYKSIKNILEKLTKNEYKEKKRKSLLKKYKSFKSKL